MKAECHRGICPCCPPWDTAETCPSQGLAQPCFPFQVGTGFGGVPPLLPHLPGLFSNTPTLKIKFLLKGKIKSLSM